MPSHKTEKEIVTVSYCDRGDNLQFELKQEQFKELLEEYTFNITEQDVFNLK